MTDMKKAAILILHGWNLSGDKFLPLKKEFIKRGYKVYSPDMPGFGKSGFPPKPLYLSDYVHFVGEYLKKNKLDDVTIIGHSFGGRISIKLAANHPRYLNALILSGAPGINPVSQSKIYFFLVLAKIGNILFSIPGLSLMKDLSRKLLYRTARASDFYNTDKNMRDTFKNIIREDLIPYMPRMGVPTLLLWGRNDGIVPLWIAAKMNKIINGSELAVIDDARHGVPWTHPEEFADRVEKFLQNNAL